MKKIIISICCLFIIINLIYSQEKWVQDPRITAKFPQENFAPIPKILNKWENQNTTVRYIYTPYGVMAISPNIRVLPNSNQQNSVILVCNPVNQLIMFGSANTTVGAVFGQGVYVTINGGASWFGTDVIPNLPTATSDPAPVIDKNGVFIISTLNTTASVTPLLASYSNNNGTTWSFPYTITGVSSDKPMSGTDDISSSAYYGRTYTVWTNMVSTQPPIMVSYTANSGNSWSTPLQINYPPSGHYSQGCDVAVGQSGNVYVCWASATMSLPYTEDYAGFAKSVNGGASWTITENIFDMNGIRNFEFNGWGVRVNSFPRMAVDKSGGPRNGWIYIVTCDQGISPAGNDPDIILHRSVDGGSSWGSGIRVNQDAINNGKVQFFPAINVDGTGGINIVYYDNRNYPSFGDSCETYMSRSVDGGDSWTDLAVSDHRWKPKGEPGFGNYMGDYIGITSGNNKIWPFWFDDKSGTFQAWTTSIDIGPTVIHTPLTSTETTTGTRAVNCIIIPAGSNINSSLTKIYYSKNSTTFTDSVAMTNTSGNNWTANITLSGAGLYRYYIKAVDMLNRAGSSPINAPATYHSFTAGADTVRPVIVHKQLDITPKVYWPVNVTATVTDNMGVDSVWVEWYINNPTPIRKFRLTSSGGNNYSANFNSVNSDVNIGDIIHYVIKAVDVSSNHNIGSLPATGYYAFSIVLLRLREGFWVTQFPPQYWTITGGGASYWSRNNVSSYGLGNGSAKFAFWDATNGTTATLTSLTFDASLPIDSLRFDIAHAFYTGSVDAMNVEASTNGGTSYSLVAAMTGGVNFSDPLCMSTVTSTSSFTPYPNQWKARRFQIPLGTNKVRFTTISAYGNNMYLDSICLVNPTSGVRNIGIEIPSSYKLEQNYPNPFNPVTKIRFDVSGHPPYPPSKGEAFVSLKVYDILGKEIQVLVNEQLQPGNYESKFDGNNLPSGIYFYQLSINNVSFAVRKMVLLK
jgi:hypothetical protein